MFEKRKPRLEDLVDSILSSHLKNTCSSFGLEVEREMLKSFAKIRWLRGKLVHLVSSSIAFHPLLEKRHFGWVGEKRIDFGYALLEICHEGKIEGDWVDCLEGLFHTISYLSLIHI